MTSIQGGGGYQTVTFNSHPAGMNPQGTKSDVWILLLMILKSSQKYFSLILQNT